MGGDTKRQCDRALPPDLDLRLVCAQWGRAGGQRAEPQHPVRIRPDLPPPPRAGGGGRGGGHRDKREEGGRGGQRGRRVEEGGWGEHRDEKRAAGLLDDLRPPTRGVTRMPLPCISRYRFNSDFPYKKRQGGAGADGNGGSAHGRRPGRGGAAAWRRTGSPRTRSQYRFRNRGTEYISETGIKRVGGSAKRPCDRA
jgi:hypothetical protein